MNDFNNIFSNFLPVGAKVKSKSRRYVLKPIDPNNMFEQKIETHINQNGFPESQQTSSVYIADCQHIIGLENSNGLASQCTICGATLCINCSSLRCRRCLSIICFRCSRVIDESEVYCVRCRRIVYLNRFGRKAHQFMSKRIS